MNVDLKISFHAFSQDFRQRSHEYYHQNQPLNSVNQK